MALKVRSFCTTARRNGMVLVNQNKTVYNEIFRLIFNFYDYFSHFRRNYTFYRFSCGFISSIVLRASWRGCDIVVLPNTSPIHSFLYSLCYIQLKAYRMVRLVFK
mmetsp:Transcript_23624/g.3922  ORF Transcript_23624/g.3922 Transcript_23624/m.3922 type:complete len:105 (+) Transcript_23624:946-1260(+)